MYIQIQNKILEFENKLEITQQILNSIDELLKKENLQFSHLIIDGEVIYDDFYNYINENIKNIEKVEVVVLTLDEMIKEMILSSYNYVKNAIPIINKLAEKFYQRPSENTWSELSDLFEGIQWIMESQTQINSINNLDTVVNDYDIWNEYVQEISKLHNIIPELENAILGKDNILIGDITLYEIVPVFEAMLKKLEFLTFGE
ncbi:methionine synthase II (cobalamin-independent) [Sedimentibacter acidaminivorans]|uniref:Methionine synthase II (Cobalamin-independent) n=1 Tax=Sedimentibacter acidaminivorans TaxID=913099 RepID=A0ABS4GDG3_9FIRM|nr:hypothetical protein [Sedimentibacter acidaminivorans]MBP1925714.1 methionine synthase II (cobalamin-independent) [Sedimentibacter acidaminivorans]